MLFALAGLALATHVKTFDVDPTYTKSPFSGLESLAVDPAVATAQLKPTTGPFPPTAEVIRGGTRVKDGALVFTNPTQTWAEMSINGLVVGVIGPYATSRFEGLAAGQYLVALKLPTGFVRDFVATAGPLRNVTAPPQVKLGEKKLELSDKVYFELDSAVIDSDSFGLLDEVAKVLAGAADVQLVRIEGHTDSRGATAYNQKLSDARAKAVLDYLVSKGVAPERLESAGFGESMPVDPAENEDAWDKNRRVEFVIAKRAEPAPVTEPAPVRPGKKKK
jgi:outer membrane protein OmpA-like peptidoglycan-associated protein